MNAKSGFHRYKRKRDANEGEIVKALIARGFEVKVMDEPCDLLIYAPQSGRSFIGEVKMPDGELSKAQRLFWPTWNGEKYILVTVEHVDAIPL